MLLMSTARKIQRNLIYNGRGWLTSTVQSFRSLCLKVPSSCLQDESISITVEDLKPGQNVTIRTQLTDVRNVLYHSYAHFCASADGLVDVDTMPSIGGQFKGLHPMGLIGSMMSALEKDKFARFFKKDVDKPNKVTISVYDGHLNASELTSNMTPEPLSSVVHERHYMAPGVTRIPVRHGRVRGALFLPPGDGPFPAVVDMFGTAGGLLEFRSAQFASRGIASLALAFFGYDDLPPDMESLDLDYFEEAANFLVSHEKVRQPHVGVVGVSKGADLALSMACYIPCIKAAVWINGFPCNFMFPLRVRGKIIPNPKLDPSGIKITEGGLINTVGVFQNWREIPESILPFEKSDAQFLFLNSQDDQNLPSEMSVDYIDEKMKEAGRTNYETVLHVTPLSCLQDESIIIKVTGLTPGQNVTIRSSVIDPREVVFHAFAHFSADSNGKVDVTEMESVGGHYTGVFPMGLIGCLTPAPGHYEYSRFFKKDVQTPNKITICVYDGHLNASEFTSNMTPEPLSSVVHERHYMAPGVTRIPVRHGRVRGALFLPPGEGPFPGLVDMFGTAGGLLEFRSAQFASRGIASLALAFFAYDDLQLELKELDVEYFQEAVDYLLAHEKVSKPLVGVLGVSKGADLVLSVATYVTNIGAAVWINGHCSNTISPMRLRDGRIVPGVTFDLESLQVQDGQVIECANGLQSGTEHPECSIPFEKSKANFLFLISMDDLSASSDRWAQEAIKRLQENKNNNFEVARFPMAGHLLEPPFSPHCYASYHKAFNLPMAWGGEPRAHTYAQVFAWARTLSFLKRHLLSEKRNANASKL